MANEIEFINHSTREVLFDQLALEITPLILRTIDSNGFCNLLLSGGTTPGPLYRKISMSLKSMEQINWGLVDERFVEPESEFSNEKMIRTCLGKYAKIIGMIQNSSDRIVNRNEVEKSYNLFLKQTDISILGMGPDGHYASIFPGDIESEKIRKSKYAGIINTGSPNFPNERITCSPEMICKSNFIFLPLLGKEKLKILMDHTLNLPIHDVLVKRPDIKIYYAD